MCMGQLLSIGMFSPARLPFYWKILWHYNKLACCRCARDSWLEFGSGPQRSTAKGSYTISRNAKRCRDQQGQGDARKSQMGHALNRQIPDSLLAHKHYGRIMPIFQVLGTVELARKLIFSFCGLNSRTGFALLFPWVRCWHVVADLPRCRTSTATSSTPSLHTSFSRPAPWLHILGLRDS